MQHLKVPQFNLPWIELKMTKSKILEISTFFFFFAHHAIRREKVLSSRCFCCVCVFLRLPEMFVYGVCKWVLLSNRTDAFITVCLPLHLQWFCFFTIILYINISILNVHFRSMILFYMLSTKHHDYLHS